MRLEKAIGSKGKQPCKRTASETQTHSQSFQKRKWLDWASNSQKLQDMGGNVWTWTRMYLNDLKLLGIAGNDIELPKRAGNSWKQKFCLFLLLQSTRTQQSDGTFPALCPPVHCSVQYCCQSM